MSMDIHLSEEEFDALHDRAKIVASTWGRDVYVDIAEEMERQNEKYRTFSRSRPDLVMLAVLTEEVGEAAECVLKADVDHEAHNSTLRAELVQIAAVAVQWLAYVDQRHLADQLDGHPVEGDPNESTDAELFGCDGDICPHCGSADTFEEDPT